MYVNNQNQVYAPEQLGITWGDIKSAAGQGLESAKGAYDTYKEAQVRAKIAEEQMKARAAAQRAPGFMDKYGLFLVIGGVGLVALLLLRRKK